MPMEIWQKIYPYLIYLIENDIENKKTTNAFAIVELLKMMD
ncbi:MULTISPECIES: hypothetical protein [Convivina]|uniref:Uncharacterized protein n=2 Tax=Convivina TaxID=1697027 RepID=A0A2U1D3F6_9LACO|nr:MULTISPECIES: hypothetical protein [Convivina]SDC22562.1 hypothetical protein SAMN05216341_1253 [Leuconostocaceae bacterium R-53105]PVY82201.1 hypothetical protein C7384_1154 [Convivina intestini]CAH1854527.1 hypothetical protein R077815_01071 [Convivina sp. LMG 32447]CAH1855779.1 hypothetical protein R078138_01209 [Convivina sp. LMG 32447]CAH1855879.1 hypothetical protein LMG032447_01185 [Convivina sp. LMG 32447]